MTSFLYSPAFRAVAGLHNMVLSPLLSGPLLLSVTYFPEKVRGALKSLEYLIPGQLAPTASYDLSTIKTVLRVLLALGFLRQVNRVLNVMASNSWRLRAARGWDWPNEVAVVTGGCSGIGKSVVERLVELGVRVAIFDVQDPPKEFQANQRIRFYRCDLTSPQSVAAAADAVRRDLGHPSILINNAGIAKPTPILKTSESYLHKIFGVNVMALWYTTQQFLPRMIQLNKGHVVTVASIASFLGLSDGADYAATKAGALAFHESLVSEIKHQYKAPNVLATIVHPNFVSTPMVADFSDHLKRSGVRLLTSDRIASDLVAQIRSKRAAQLIIPPQSARLSAVRGWPTWIQELLRDAVARMAARRQEQQ